MARGCGVSPCPRILMRREAPSGAQPQELADRARYPESPRRGPRVLRTPAPGSPPLRRRSDPPSLRQRLGRTPKETGSRSRMVGGGCTGRRENFWLLPDGSGSPGNTFPQTYPHPPKPRPPRPAGCEQIGGAPPRAAYPAGPSTRPEECAPPGVQAGPGLWVARRRGTWHPATHRWQDSPAERSAEEGPSRQRGPEVAGDLPLNEVILDELGRGEPLRAVGSAVNRFLYGLYVDFFHYL